MCHIRKYIYPLMGLMLIFGMILACLQIPVNATIRSPTLSSHILTHHLDLSRNSIETFGNTVHEVNPHDTFSLDPKEEPEKGFILIGLGLVIIFIILGVLHYYKKKREKEDPDREKEDGEPETEGDEHSEKNILKTVKKDRKGYPGRSPTSAVKRTKTEPPPRELAQARKKLVNGGSSARKKALKIFHEAVEEDPGNIIYAAEGIIPCLEDKNDTVKRETLRLIEMGGGVYPDEFIDHIEDMADLLVHDDKEIRRAARRALILLAAGSDRAEKGILDSMEERYKAKVEDGSLREDFLTDCHRLNKFLVELGRNSNESIPGIMNILLRCITYPIYRPEQSEEEEEELYRSGGNSISILSEYAPGTIPLVLPKILKVLSDTYIFENWKEDADDEESMRTVYKDIFNRLTAGDPADFIDSLLKYSSSTNRTMERLVRERLMEMAAEDHEPVLRSVIDAFESGDGSIRKNAGSTVERIASMDPAASSEILMTCIGGKNERTAQYAAKALKNLLESTEKTPLKDIDPVLKLMERPAHEVRREAVALLGKIIEMDTSLANRCVKYIVKGLKQEWGVRLEALSSLGRISKVDPILRKFSIPFIIEGLEDKHEQVKWRASNILKELGINEDDIKHYESARRQMDMAEPKLRELRKGTALDLDEITHELSRAKDMMKETNYREADLLAIRTNEMLIELQAGNRPEIDLVMEKNRKFVEGKHTPFKLILINTGMVHVFDITIGFSQNVEIIEEAPVYIKAGGEQDMSLAWTPPRAGRMPLKITCSFKDKSGAVRELDKDIWIDVLSEDIDMEAEKIKEDLSVAAGVMWDMVFV